MGLDTLSQRQLNLGPAGFFRVEAESPAGNQVVVKAGWAVAGAYAIYDRFTAGDQTSAGFVSISGPGFKRYDLVYINATGAVAIQQGTEVALAAPVYQGGPGFTGGPNLIDQIVPLAFVLITETGSVIVTSDDITNVSGIFQIGRNLDGFLVDKGALGSAPTGASSVVTTLFAGETSGGGTTTRGVVTSAPMNFVVITDQNGDELIQKTTSSRIYGRLTFGGGIWTLSYFYLNASGVETAVVAIQTETEGGAPTDIKLIGTPKVYTRSDPARPLFDTSVYRLLDQIAADIPTATTTVQGKVIGATGSPNPPQAGAVNEALSAGVPVGGGPFYRLSFPGGSVTGAAGVLTINAAGPPGPPGAPGASGGPGPPGPGFASQGPFQISPDIPSFPSQSSSTGFSFGFTIRFYMVCWSKLNLPIGGGADTIEITNVTPSGSSLTVNWTVTDVGGVADIIARLGASAAG